MKVWKLGCEVDCYKDFFLKNEADKEIITNSFDKAETIKQWSPLELVGLDNIRQIGDNPMFWSYSNIIMSSKPVKEVLDKTYGKFIQFIPVIDRSNNAIYYLFNILKIIDGIDYEKSEFKKLLNIHIVDVTNYVLKNYVRNLPIFKLVLNGSVMTPYIYVNDDFKKIIEDNKFKGLKFTKIYEFKD